MGHVALFGVCGDCGEAGVMLDRTGAVAVEALDPSDVDAGVAAHYGDPMREQRLLATAVGLVDRSNRGVLAVPGRRTG